MTAARTDYATPSFGIMAEIHAAEKALQRDLWPFDNPADSPDALSVPNKTVLHALGHLIAAKELMMAHMQRLNQHLALVESLIEDVRAP